MGQQHTIMWLEAWEFTYNERAVLIMLCPLGVKTELISWVLLHLSVAFMLFCSYVNDDFFIIFSASLSTVHYPARFNKSENNIVEQLT
jgi:hypothetical protein